MRIHTSIGAGLVVLLGVLSAGAGEKSGATAGPSSPAAKAAIAECDRATKAAEDAYRKARVDALTALTVKLEAAKQSAMREQGSLEEAQRIQAMLDETREDLAAVQAEGRSRRVVVRADQDWRDVVPVQTGSKLTITATGRWRGAPSHKAMFGPDGTRDAYHLEARVGNGTPFKVGERFEGAVPADGLLQLRMMDKEHADNEGAVVAIVTLSTPQ